MTDSTNCKILQDNPFNTETWIKDMAKLQCMFGRKFIPFDECQNSHEKMVWWKRDLVIDLQEEWSEVLRCLPWKHWKAYKDFALNLEDIRYEAIDCLHFVLNLYLLLVNRKVRADYYLDFSYINQGRMFSDVNVLTEQVKDLVRTEYRVADMALSSSVLNDGNTTIVLRCMSGDLAKLFSLLGMDEEMVYTYYCRKNQENYDRQERGY